MATVACLVGPVIAGASSSAAAATPADASSGSAASNLQVKYDFNDGSGTTAQDSSGNGYNGTLVDGASFTGAGDHFGGLSLNGDGGYVSIPNAALNGLNNLTLSENVDLTAVSGHVWLATLGYNNGDYLGIDIEGDKMIAYYVNGGNSYTVSGTPPTVGQWDNVTLALSSTDETMSLYLNGALEATTTGMSGDFSTLYESTETVGGWISNNVWGNPPLDATVDDFRLYNTALTADQVTAVADEGPAQPATVSPVSVSTVPGVAPTMPSTVGVANTDGTSQSLPVTWPSIPSSDYASAGTFTLTGTTDTTPALTATATVGVLPKPVLTSTGKTETTASLSWQSESLASTYNLYRSATPDGSYQKVYSGPATSYTDTGLSLATTYYYYLTYTTADGATSVESSPLSITTDTKLVGPPTVTQAPYLQANEIDLNWNAVPLADSYDVYRSASANGPLTLLKNVKTTSLDDKSVQTNTTYYYEVACVNAAGVGPKSAPLEAKTAKDNVPPTTLRSTGRTASTISLKWAAAKGATSYSLFRTTTSGSGYALVYSGKATSYTDTDLVTGTPYYYVVEYTSKLGTSLNSNQVKVTTVAVKLPPASEIQVTGRYANAIDLSWNSVVGATSFKLYRSRRKDSGFTLIAHPTANGYSDTGLRAGTTYYYEIASVDAAGTGRRSSAFKASTSSGTSTVFTNKAASWVDVDGKPINAGSGDILRVGRTYYLYGGGSGPFDVNVYSSTDLVHWKFVNEIITTNKTLGTDGKPAADLQSSTGNHFERIKVIYDAKTKEYVLWAHYENAGYTLAQVGTAYSKTPTGDFTWDHAFNPAGLDSRDETVFVDNDGTGYLISASGGFHGPDTDVNSHLTLFQMTPDDLSIQKAMYNIYGGSNDSGLYAGREAPAMVWYQGYYYLVTSEASGWYPSPAMYSVAKGDSLADTTASSWKGNTDIDASGGWNGGGEAYYLGNRNDFGGQSVYILPVTGTNGTSFLYMNDTLDPKGGGTTTPMWLPLQLHDGVATLNYTKQININAHTGEISNMYPGSLLSQGKPATASSVGTTSNDGAANSDGWSASYANDGNYNTAWVASSDSYPWWWEVDLGQESIINDVQLSWWMIGGSEATEEFTVSVSDDGVHWKVAYSDLDDTQYGFNDCPIPSVEARYVRVTGYSAPTQNRGTTWYIPQIYEARVYGKSAPNSATVTTANKRGNYLLQVPSNIVNYPAGGDFWLNLGPVSVDYPTADLLENLGHGTLTASNDHVGSAVERAIRASVGGTLVGAFRLGLEGASGPPVGKLRSAAAVTVHLTRSEVKALRGRGTRSVYLYQTSTRKLSREGASFDLAKATVTFRLRSEGVYAIALK